uniref:Reverse transcriptase domain-containing protein n=1 Tax=Nicotiana tabacum TaxID=4097 RepID=A0A1S3YN39_TOBAC|nr:PREDICTED: uncharacterized protein LOC107777786 [Nicotiana tabacum]
MGTKEPSQHNTTLPVGAKEKQDDRGKAMQNIIELNFTSFPTLTPIPMKNIFEVVSTSRYEDQIPHGDRGGNTIVPFSFFNIWTEHDDFTQLVTSIRSSHSPQGSLKSVWARLKDLNLALKSLNSKEFSGITHKIEKARIELSDIQGKISQGCTDTLLNMEKKVILNLEKWSLIEESVLQQKAIAKWIQPGDSNSKYFTAVMKDRSQEKQIIKTTTLLGDKLTDLDAIKREIVDFYKSLMGTTATTLPAINRIYMKHGPTLSYQQRVDLYTEIIDVVKEFFTIGKLYKAINCTTITLVPKVNKPTTVKEYILIACCSILYKMISKILASRLQKVMPYTICEAHASFIHSRKITDNVILAHELVKSYTNAQISPICMIKIDLQKDYDLVEWIFLQQVIKEIRFTDRFIRWIMELTEYLSRSLHELKKEPDFQYHPRCRKLGITHMSFAENLLLFAKGNLSFVATLYKCFTRFSQASCFHANLGKSSVYFGGVKQVVKDQILAHLGFTSGSLPFKYLDIPLSTKKIALIEWQPLIEKITSKISSSTTKKLSNAGRVQLVQFVIFCIQAY